MIRTTPMRGIVLTLSSRFKTGESVDFAPDARTSPIEKMTSHSPMANNRLADCLAAVCKKIDRVERNVRRLEELNESANEMLGVDWLEFWRHEKNFLRILYARRERVKDELKKYNETHPTKDRKGDAQREVLALLRECPGFVTKLIEAGKRPEKGEEKARSCDCEWWNITRGCSWDNCPEVKTEAQARKYYLKAYWLTACLNNLEMLTEGLGHDCPRVFSETLADGKDLLWLIMSGKDVEEDEGDAPYEILQRVKASAVGSGRKDEDVSPDENNK